MRTSIALCTYNGAAFLREQLASFDSQTVLPDELVVCDDQSSDGTLRILEEHAATAPYKVNIHVNPVNLGSNQNFARAIGLCQGEIIFLSDQDDVWRSDKIARMIAELDRHPTAGFAFTNAALVSSELAPMSARLWECVGFDATAKGDAETIDLFSRLARQYLVTGATMAFRRKYVSSILPLPGGWVHDGWIAAIVAAFADAVAIDQDLIQYRQHAQQQLGAPRRARVFGIPVNRPLSDWGMTLRQWSLELASLVRRNGPDRNDEIIQRRLERYRGLLTRLEHVRLARDPQPRAELSSCGDDSLPERRFAANLELLAERVAYLENRLKTRREPHLWGRWKASWRQLKSGAYHRSGLGYFSFLRDALRF